MGSFDLTDEQWILIEDLFPLRRRMGRPPRSDRQMFNGMLWVVQSGSSWRTLPEVYGPWQTVYHRFNLWRKTGLWDNIISRLTHAETESALITAALGTSLGHAVQSASPSPQSTDIAATEHLKTGTDNK